MPFSTRKTHQGIFRLQIHQVVLVDAGRHDQERLSMHLVGKWRVLDELDQSVLEHDRPRP